MSEVQRTGARRLALVRVGRFRLALDGALVESVVPGPLTLAPFPCVAPHVRGAFSSRLGPMPVIDLAALLDGAPAAVASDTVAMAAVLHVADGHVAVAIDEVLDLAVPMPESLSTIDLRSPSGAGLFTELFAPADGTPPAVVLDIDALLRIADLHIAVRPAEAMESVGGDGADAVCVVLFRAGETVFGIDGGVVRQVERRTDVDDVGMRHPSMRGFRLLNGRHIAILDLLATLGLPESRRADAGSHLVLLDDGDGASSGLVVDDIVAVVHARTDEIQPIADDAPERGPLVSGCLRHAVHGIVVLIDAAQLLAGATMLGAAARLGAATDGGREVASGGALQHYMVYRAAGGLLASLLGDIAAVAQLPADFVDLRQQGSATVGLFTRLGTTIQVMDLGALMGAPPRETVVDQPILVVDTPEGARGFLLDSVAFLRAAAPQRIPSPGRRQIGFVPRFAEMILVQSDGADFSATVLDLRQLASNTSQRRPESAVSAAA